MPKQTPIKTKNTPVVIAILVLGLLLAGGFAWYLAGSQSKGGKITNKAPAVVALPVPAFPPVSQLTESFVNQMQELGYTEGTNITYLRHELIQPNPEGMVKIREVLKGYIEQNVDLLVVSSNPDALVALEETKNAGKTIPIVALDATNPVDVGLAKSFASSGNNFTGVVELRSESVGRLLEMMERISPGVKKLGYLSHGFIIPAASAPATDYLEKLKAQAKIRGITVVEYTTDVAPGPALEKELQRVLGGVKKGEIDAWTHIPGHFIPNQQVYEDVMVRRLKIPFGSPGALEVDPKTGEMVGLFSYGVNFARKGKQGAVMADKVLKGTRPSDIPLEPPDKYDLVINLKVAKEIGVAIPNAVLTLADELKE